MAGATQGIFMGGKKVANLKVKKFKYEQLFEAYKQTDLNAIKEVNAILCKIKDDNEIFAAVYQKSDKEHDNFRLTNLNFKEGTYSKMDVLNSEITLYRAYLEVLNRKTARLIDYITLYKAAGANL